MVVAVVTPAESVLVAMTVAVTVTADEMVTAGLVWATSVGDATTTEDGTTAVADMTAEDDPEPATGTSTALATHRTWTPSARIKQHSRTAYLANIHVIAARVQLGVVLVEKRDVDAIAGSDNVAVVAVRDDVGVRTVGAHPAETELLARDEIGAVGVDLAGVDGRELVGGDVLGSGDAVTVFALLHGVCARALLGVRRCGQGQRVWMDMPHDDSQWATRERARRAATTERARMDIVAGV